MGFKIFGLQFGKKKRKLYGIAAENAARKAAGLPFISSGGGRKKGGKNSKNLDAEAQRYARDVQRLTLESKRLDLEVKRAEIEARRAKIGDDPMANALRQITSIKKFSAALKDVAGEPDEDDTSVRGILGKVAANVGQGLGAAVGEMARQQMANQQAGAPPVAAYSAPVPQISAPAQPQQAAQPQPDPSQPQPATGGAPVDFQSIYLISQLNGKSPEQAARWLAAQDRDEAKQIITAMIQTPDEHLGQLVLQIQNPLPQFGQWLAQRMPWFVEVARALRTMNAKYANTPSADAL